LVARFYVVFYLKISLEKQQKPAESAGFAWLVAD